MNLRSMNKQKGKGGIEMEKFLKFFKDEDGLETVEYAVIGGIILVATIATVVLIGQQVSTRYTQILNALSGS
jgi:Flp pilus assembly pilin Flp